MLDHMWSCNLIKLDMVSTPAPLAFFSLLLSFPDYHIHFLHDNAGAKTQAAVQGFKEASS
jgi:hypothetical protein